MSNHTSQLSLVLSPTTSTSPPELLQLPATAQKSGVWFLIACSDTTVQKMWSHPYGEDGKLKKEYLHLKDYPKKVKWVTAPKSGTLHVYLDVYGVPGEFQSDLCRIKLTYTPDTKLPEWEVLKVFPRNLGQGTPVSRVTYGETLDQLEEMKQKFELLDAKPESALTQQALAQMTGNISTLESVASSMLTRLDHSFIPATANENIKFAEFGKKILTA